jgi:hypothetical protein
VSRRDIKVMISTWIDVLSLTGETWLDGEVLHTEKYKLVEHRHRVSEMWK